MSTQRVCFQLQLKPGLIAEYKARHAAVWPELSTLKSSGWNNYALFLRPDGLLIGYFETDNLEEAQGRTAATDVNARWQAEMSGLFDDLNGAPDEGFLQLTEVFNLEDQPRRRRSALTQPKSKSLGD